MKRDDIQKILIIGAGPIVIGQACEFDYSGTQACRVLKEEGYKVVLLNSNPATIMTDPELADATYIEPITLEFLEKIIKKEKPCAILPTLGGQTALNLAFSASKKGLLKKYNVELIGAAEDVIARAEDRKLFKQTMKKAGIDLPRSHIVYNIADARKVIKELGFPLVIRPAFTMGGSGGGIAYNKKDFEKIVGTGLEQSIISSILIEEGLLGWKEFELEVMRDKNDNAVIICSIENFDPMGVHTGDSITVAPAQTLTDKQYQQMRTYGLDAIRAIGVETGGCNAQFAVNPRDGRIVIIEVNPRVSRSSALASKATGFPIAKIAAKLAVGYTLDEIQNDITKVTPACFEPAIDYTVVKIPRFAFEKFPQADPALTTAMKSVGEVMAIGRTFKEALQKGIRGLEVNSKLKTQNSKLSNNKKIKDKLRVPNADRLFYIFEAFRQGFSIDAIYKLTFVDKWFLANIKEIVDFELKIKTKKILNKEELKQAKILGFADKQLASILNTTEEEIAKQRNKNKIKPVYKLVDTCAGEFEASTPYYYSSYDKEDESRISDKKKVMILGGGPNRIGQGLEFDYCCVHAALSLREEGFETIMVNSNPETVSTDYDISDKLYFEPVTREDVLAIIRKEKPTGVVLQFGGQTPLNLALALKKAGVNIWGTSAASVDATEDRDKFKKLLEKLKLNQAPSGIAYNFNEALNIARKIEYPVMVRPSYVLGGRAMKIVYDETYLKKFVKEALEASDNQQILIDKFLINATELDVDCIGDGVNYNICGILEHIEEAGIHSGDSAMSIPTYTMSQKVIEKIRKATYKLAHELKIIGLMNIQYAVFNDEIYVIEVNPRASRTIPFISKAIGVPLAKLAAKVMTGITLKQLKFTSEVSIPYFCIKESVFPFNRFSGVDIVLGPEMKSTGEAMGIDKDFAAAYAKAQIGAWEDLCKKGVVLISVQDSDKKDIIPIAREFAKIGLKIVATKGTADALKKASINIKKIYKPVSEDSLLLLDMQDKKIDIIINTASSLNTKYDGAKVRSHAVKCGIACTTTVAGAKATMNAIKVLRKDNLKVKSLQEYYCSA